MMTRLISILASMNSASASAKTRTRVLRLHRLSHVDCREGRTGGFGAVRLRMSVLFGFQPEVMSDTALQPG
jgi:hypothetical protein